LPKPKQLKRPARWRKGQRVRWWTIVSQRGENVGTLVEPGTDSDLRQRVLWDHSREPMWVETDRLWPEEWTLEQIHEVYSRNLEANLKTVYKPRL
jgi:hypothetical protein